VVTIPEVSTNRLQLRGWRDADRAPFAAMNADPVVMEHFPAPLDRAASDALVDRFLEHWAEHGFGIWAVERRGDAKFIGLAGMYRPSFEAHFTPAVEVGWRLAHDAWGHGYATEAGAAALRFGFEQARLDEIVSFTVPANERSRRVMERIGMHRDPAGDFDHPRIPPGHRLRRHVLYRLGREEWLRTRTDAQT
jgi:RimJ/RimL family protein N-acetyltransferase